MGNFNGVTFRRWPVIVAYGLLVIILFNSARVNNPTTEYRIDGKKTTTEENPVVVSNDLWRNEFKILMPAGYNKNGQTPNTVYIDEYQTKTKRGFDDGYTYDRIWYSSGKQAGTFGNNEAPFDADLFDNGKTYMLNFSTWESGCLVDQSRFDDLPLVFVKVQKVVYLFGYVWKPWTLFLTFVVFILGGTLMFWVMNPALIKKLLNKKGSEEDLALAALEA